MSTIESEHVRTAFVHPGAPPVQPPEVLPVAKAQPTAYMVLGQDADGDWVENGWFDGSNATAAIKAFIGGEVHGYRAYVAIPKRSWNPVKPTTETKTITKFGSAS